MKTGTLNNLDLTYYLIFSAYLDEKDLELKKDVIEANQVNEKKKKKKKKNKKKKNKENINVFLYTFSLRSN